MYNHIKQNFFAIVALIFGASVHSQAQVSIGAKAGGQFANVHTTEILGTYAPEFRVSTGATAGIMAEIPFGSVFALQPEVNWAQKGFTWNEGIGVEISNVPVPIGVRASFQTNYVDVPLLAKVKLGNGPVQAYLTAGPSVGYAFDATLITRPRLLFELDPIRTDINLNTIDYKRWEVSGVVGAGLSMDAGPLSVVLDARYTRGFTQLYDFPVINEQIKNHGLSLTAGVLVPLKQEKKTPTKSRTAPRPRA